MKVECNPEDSCYQATSNWAMITVLLLFFFPAILCVCCLCCMSSNTSDLVYCLYASTLGRCCPHLSYGAQHRHGRRPDQRGRVAASDRNRSDRSDGREVELQQWRNTPPPPPPPPRVNFISLQGKVTTLAALEKSDKDAQKAAIKGSSATKLRELGDDPVCAICLSDLERTDKVFDRKE